MKIFSMGWVALMMTLGSVQAEWTFSSSSNNFSPRAPTERWIQACDLFGRNNDNDDDTAPTDNDSSCGGLDVCNEEHELITATVGGSECKCNFCDGLLTITCERCSGCDAFEGKDACIDSSTITYYLEAPPSDLPDEDRYYQFPSAKRNITSSGADSASNNVVERVSFECAFNTLGIDPENPSLSCWNNEFYESYVRINGVSCDSATEDERNCKIYDCRNINSDYYWTCNDFDEIRSNPSHPLHGLLASDLYCSREG